MKITTVRGWDPLDPKRGLDVGRSHRSDLSRALAVQSSCESPSCDICCAREARFPLVAAELLRSVIETPLLDALERAHRFNRTFVAVGLDEERRRWGEYRRAAERSGRRWRCTACGGFSWGSEACGHCLSPRPVWRLVHAAHCGSVAPVLSDLDRGMARDRTAGHLRWLRRRGLGVAVRRRGAEWEVREPDGSAFVPADCGTLSLELGA